MNSGNNVKDDFDTTIRLYTKTSQNRAVELKYPNYSQLDLQSLVDRNYLKNVFFNMKQVSSASSEPSHQLLTHSLLGIYTNSAFDQSAQDYKLIVQGFTNKKAYSYKNKLKIGDLIIAINDIAINRNNVNVVLSSIRAPQVIKLTAISPVGHVPLGNFEDLLRDNYLELFKFKPKEKTNGPKCLVASSKSTSVVMGERIKPTDPDLENEMFMLVMILSWGKAAVKKQTYKDKSDLIYRYPPNSEESSITVRNRLNNEVIVQIIETVRGLLMSLACAVKDINKNDEAVCASFQCQDQIYRIAFLSEFYGTNGQMVVVVPSEQINSEHFKLMAENLNHTFKFTFGSVLPKLLNHEAAHDDDQSVTRHLASTRTQIDHFFVQFNKRVNRVASFHSFDKLNLANKVNLFDEMRSGYINSIPRAASDLPHGLRLDLDSVLYELEAQEFINDLEIRHYKYKRMFIVTGGCLFYKNMLLVSHLNNYTVKSVYDYCSHYDLFSLTKTGNTNQFQIWREIDLNKNKKTNSRHFLILVGLRQLTLAVILESGSAACRRFDDNTQIEPDPFYISRVASILHTLGDNGIINEIDTHLSAQSPILFNLDKLLTQPKGTLKKNSKQRDSRSPVRLKIKPKRDNSQPKSSIEPSSSAASRQNLTNLDESDRNNLYHSKKLTRNLSLSELSLYSTCSSKSTRHHQLFKIATNHDELFTDVLLNDYAIYYASSENQSNGIIFAPHSFNLNSPVFNRFFLKYVDSCFKIRRLFESHVPTNSECELVEQGVLFKLSFTEEDLKPHEIVRVVDKSDKIKIKELDFWVVGRRKFRQDPESKNRSLGDMFICFQDAVDDILLELAFDIGFSRFS